jgi:hypothetical protein
VCWGKFKALCLGLKYESLGGKTRSRLCTGVHKCLSNSTNGIKHGFHFPALIHSIPAKKDWFTQCWNLLRMEKWKECPSYSMWRGCWEVHLDQSLNIWWSLPRPVLHAAGELQKPIKLVLLERVVANMQISAGFLQLQPTETAECICIHTPYFECRSVYHIQHTMLIIPPSPYKNMKKWQYKMRNYLNITASGNHYGWPMKKIRFLLRVILEGTVYGTNYRPWIFVLPAWLLYFIQNIVYISFYGHGWRSSAPQKLPTSTRKFTPHSVDSMSTWLVSEKFKHLSVENVEGKIEATYLNELSKLQC